MGRRAALREDLLDAAESFPLGAQAYVFSNMFVKAAKYLDIDETSALTDVLRVINRQILSYEDRTALIPPPIKEIKHLSDHIADRLERFSHYPTYETVIVLRECLAGAAKRGAPPKLIEALIRSFWGDLDLLVVRLEDDKKDRGNFNGLRSKRYEA